ncbi:MAG: low temperature requirement protein A [Clostridia bacterium]|nr:low temperature requirement protein A [Clostridia bacterium]
MEMLKGTFSEKKVEYIELIYDLIFVYLIGRNNSLMDQIENGFITGDTLFTYLSTSLIILQIWYHSVLFINRFGKNGIAEKLMMLVNMFLLYFIGTNTVNDWGANYLAYMSAWVLIFLNLAGQYAWKLREQNDPATRKVIKRFILLLLVQAAVALGSVPIYRVTGYAFGAWAMIIGFVGMFLIHAPVHFEHLTERMMLYVVFTFGEMVISVAGYFSEGFSFQTLYFSLMSFLVVAGLFFSYGIVYDKLLDRSRENRSTAYMLLHIVLILSLTNITNGLEFMREPEVDALQKAIWVVVSLLLYFACLALTVRWSNRTAVNTRQVWLLLLSEFVVYAVVTFLTLRSNRVTVLLTVIFIYAQLLTLMLAEKRLEKKEAA